MAEIKEEILGEYLSNSSKPKPSSAPSLAAAWKPPIDLIDLSSSDSGSNSDSDSDSGDSSGPDEDGAGGGTHRRPKKKKKKVESSQGTVALPVGFLDPLPLKEARLPLPATAPAPLAVRVPGEMALALAVPAPGARGTAIVRTEYSSRQFWKAGDYEGAPSGDWESARMDHVRVHPRFLHSNATSHMWVLGAFAELLDNALDEVCNGATFVSIDMITNKKDESRILVIEDNGGGMDPDKIRQCMSLGYSAKSKIADTIGQYGNGFKTSTMRLGADVIVFSRSCGQDGNRPTQSVGLLSYTFLRETGKEDIVVPMLDFERKGRNWSKIVRSSDTDWNRTVDTIVQWSPFPSEADLLEQFNQIKDRGTRIFIYNLWEDDEGLLELDFDADPRDIQIRGVNRDEKNIQMAQQYPNSRHFLTYRHSLRSYAAILYLRVPPGFRIILRGKDVEHHNIVNDMMMTQEVTYRPHSGSDGVPRDSNMVAVVTVGFVKDAKAHIDVQGFNVYHKNRLIKPFWRVWHAPGSDGRGVIGVLEANFVQPAHDKQGFERTIVLSRLEAKLIQMQKTYWSTYCHKIGYAPRRKKIIIDPRGDSTDHPFQTPKSSKSTELNAKTPVSEKKFSLPSKLAHESKKEDKEKGNIGSRASGRRLRHSEQSSASVEDVSDDDEPSNIDNHHENACSPKLVPSKILHKKDSSQTVCSSPRTRSCVTGKKGSECGKPVGIVDSEVLQGMCDWQVDDVGNESSSSLQELKEENRLLRARLKRKEQEFLGDLLEDVEQERNKCKLLEGQVNKLTSQLQEANAKIQEQSKEQDSLIELFAEERGRHETEEEHLRNKLKGASNTIEELVDKVRWLEKIKPTSNGKVNS